MGAAGRELRARAAEQSMGVSTDTWGGVPLLATSPFPPCGMWCYPRHPQFDLGRGFGARQLLVPHPAACWEEPPAPFNPLVLASGKGWGWGRWAVLLKMKGHFKGKSCLESRFPSQSNPRLQLHRPHPPFPLLPSQVTANPSLWPRAVPTSLLQKLCCGLIAFPCVFGAFFGPGVLGAKLLLAP